MDTANFGTIGSGIGRAPAATNYTTNFNKGPYGGANKILIDDRTDYIDQFVGAGGKGFKYYESGGIRRFGGDRSISWTCYNISMTTYAELVTQIRNYCETDDQVLTTVIINDIIEHAEHRIFRAIELASDYSYVNGNTAANNRFVKLPGNTTDPFTPRITDIASIRYVTIYTDSGTKQRSELVRVDQDFMSEYYDTPESGQTAKPKYYANLGYGHNSRCTNT